MLLKFVILPVILSCLKGLPQAVNGQTYLFDTTSIIVKSLTDVVKPLSFNNEDMENTELCEIDIGIKMKDSHSHDDWPLVLDPEDSEFYDAMAHGFIILKEGDQLRLACNGVGNRFKSLPGNIQIATVTCKKDQTFYYNGGEKKFYQDFGCQTKPPSTIIELQSNEQHINKYQIGFRITSDIFILLINIKYNNQLHQTVETSHEISRGLTSEEKQKVSDSTSFSSVGHPLGSAVANLYTQNSVNREMDRVIGVNKRQKYFDSSTQSFIVRGHMSPKADFPFASQQYATFYFLNVNPQFQGFNNGNWKELEQSIRNIEDWGIVTTKVEETLNLRDGQGNLHPLFLNGNSVPIPKIFTKKIQFFLHGTKSFEGFNFPTIRNLDQELINEFIERNDAQGYNCNDNPWLTNTLKRETENTLKGLFLCVRN